jgi:hypothetical protein
MILLHRYLIPGLWLAWTYWCVSAAQVKPARRYESPASARRAGSRT